MARQLLLITGLLLATQVFAERNRSGGGGANSPFELGKRHYETGRYPRALDLFSQAIDTSGDASVRNKAYYYQGLVLFELGHYYSAYLSFRNVLLSADDKNREVYEKAIKNAVIITDRLNMVDRLGKVLEKLPPNYIPNSVAALSHYAIGVHALKTNRDEEAMSRLKSVHPDSPYFGKAAFYLGVLATKKKDYREAVIYFKRVTDLSRGRRDQVNQSELGRLNLARSLYSMGEVEKSVEVYSQFLSSSPHWITVLLEASWPLMRVNDTTVSLGNLHTVTSPFYREDLVGEAYVLRATILYSLCKYEEMRQTLAQFFNIYDPVVRAMQAENNQLGSAESYYRAFISGKGVNRSFVNAARRDEGIAIQLKVIDFLEQEKRNLAKFSRNEQMRRMMTLIDEAKAGIENDVGATLQRFHKRKLQDLIEQREQANYLKVEIVTGEKELIEGQKGLPPKRVVDVETTVSDGYHFWPFSGEYWEDELGSFVYTTESSCVN